MPVVRVKSDGRPKKEGKMVGAVGLAAVLAGVILYVVYTPVTGIFTCVVAGALCSAYNVFDNA